MLLPGPSLSPLGVSRRRASAGGGGAGGTAALTSGAGTSLRSDYGNFVGFFFTVGALPLYVKSLGRWKVSGNSATHAVKLAVKNLGTFAYDDVVGGSVSIDLTAGSAGGYLYAALAAAITLPAGADCLLASLESSGGDQWYDSFAVTASPDLAVTGSTFYAGVWGTGVGGSQSYVPANFLYDLTP